MMIWLFQALSYFFRVLQMILMLYIISSWLPLPPRLQGFMHFIMEPILGPIRYMLKRSVLNTRMIDITPIIAYIILSFLESFFRSM